MGELFTVYGKTDGTNTTGTFTLQSEAFTNTPNYIRVDKHMKLKIWARRVAGAPATIYIQYTRDVTAASPTWVTIDAIHLVAEGELDLEKRKPVIVISRTGKEAVRFTWEQATAGITHVSFDIEIEPI